MTMTTNTAPLPTTNGNRVLDALTKWYNAWNARMNYYPGDQRCATAETVTRREHEFADELAELDPEDRYTFLDGIARRHTSTHFWDRELRVWLACTRNELIAA